MIKKIILLYQEMRKNDMKLIYGYKKFKYLIENINLEKNFKVKLVYFDLYLN